MKESKINTEIKNSLKKIGCYAIKSPDSIYNPAARFSPNKGVDLFAGVRGRFVGIETKTLKTVQAFGSQLRDSQIDVLNEMVETGNRAFVFLNIRRAGNEVSGQYDRLNRLVIFDWDLWASYFALQSFKAADLEPYVALKGIEGHKGIFDLREFADKIEKDIPII